MTWKVTIANKEGEGEVVASYNDGNFPYFLVRWPDGKLTRHIYTEVKLMPKLMWPLWQEHEITVRYLRDALAWSILALFVVLSLVFLSCVTPLSPKPDWVETEWTIAQCKVAHLVPPSTGDPYKVKLTGLELRPEPELFACGNQGLSYGCFYRNGGIIRYVESIPQVLRHEFGHYILMRLKDPREFEFEHHTNPLDPVTALTQPQPPGICE